MTDQPIKPKKSDGIVSKKTIEKTYESTKQLGQEGTFNLLQQVEPKYFEYLVDKINRDKDKLRKRGITGKDLQLMGDIMLTYGIDGFLQYKAAVSMFDSAKLNELYGQDYQAWEDSIIDQFLEQKKAKEAQAATDVKPEEPTLQIEPERPKRNPGDLVDDSELE